MPSSTSEQDFEDRFLQCFGLGDPDLSGTRDRSSTEQEAVEREEKLKVQASTSQWYFRERLVEYFVSGEKGGGAWENKE